MRWCRQRFIVPRWRWDWSPHWGSITGRGRRRRRLVLDVMELFRTTLWEMPLIGSVNRLQWDVAATLRFRPGQIWLSESGRKKAIGLFEERLEESYKHPHTGQSLTYARMIELELRLLEKEWSGCPGLFARMRDALIVTRLRATSRETQMAAEALASGQLRRPQCQSGCGGWRRSWKDMARACNTACFAADWTGRRWRSCIGN